MSTNRVVTRHEYRVRITRPDGTVYTEWRLTNEAVAALIAGLRPGFAVASVTYEARTLDW